MENVSCCGLVIAKENNDDKGYDDDNDCDMLNTLQCVCNTRDCKGFGGKT